MRRLSAALRRSVVAGLCFVSGISLSAGATGTKQVSNHEQMDCAACHQLTASLNESGYLPLDYSNVCVTCHNWGRYQDRGVRTVFHQDAARPCADCHSFHHTEKITAGDREFSLDFNAPGVNLHCQTCHRSTESVANLSPGHRAAAALYHSNTLDLSSLSPSKPCLVCHAEETSLSVGETRAEFLQAPVFDSHGSHPVGVPIDSGSGEPGNRIQNQIDARIELLDGRVECQSCHSLYSVVPNRLVAGFGVKELCRGCHRLD